MSDCSRAPRVFCVSAQQFFIGQQRSDRRWRTEATRLMCVLLRASSLARYWARPAFAQAAHAAEQVQLERADAESGRVAAVDACRSIPCTRLPLTLAFDAWDRLGRRGGSGIARAPVRCSGSPRASRGCWPAPVRSVASGVHRQRSAARRWRMPLRCWRCSSLAPGMRRATGAAGRSYLGAIEAQPASTSGRASARWGAESGHQGRHLSASCFTSAVKAAPSSCAYFLRWRSLPLNKFAYHHEEHGDEKTRPVRSR